MSTLQYQQPFGGKGTAQGLPLRRGSQLYDVEPNIRYPNVLSTGLDSDLHTYDRGRYLRVPHLPITFLVEPYISNHKAGGNFTRRQYFVIKRGQPLMAATKRDDTIGVFVDSDGSIAQRKYVDPAKLETNGKLVGYQDGTADQWYRLKEENSAGEDADALIDKAAYDALPESEPGDEGDQTDQADYEAFDMTDEDNFLSIEEFDALDDEQKEGFRGVYEGLEDTNDKIPTGGVNQYARTEQALFGSTDLAEFVEIDADSFYFGQATQVEGFIYPSTGGADRTVFFNEVDQEANVTLPTDGKGNAPRRVKPIGNVTDVSSSNAENWEGSAVVLPSRPTIGVAHTDLEQTLSHKWHMFQTGTDVHQPVRKGRLTVPFVDISKLKSIIEANTDLTVGTDFNFTDVGSGKSGLKVGVFNDDTLDVQNKYSLLTESDSGYANLYYNFAAPFFVTDHFPKLREKVVPDLFGNYTHFGAAAVNSDTNAFGNVAQSAEETAAKDGQEEHVVGKILNIYDMPEAVLTNLEVNPIFQSRIISSEASRNYLNEGYRRPRSADTAGLKPILSDFLFMLLGGSSYDWASQMLPKFGGLPQDLANVIEALVIEGAAGMVEIAIEL